MCNIFSWNKLKANCILSFANRQNQGKSAVCWQLYDMAPNIGVEATIAVAVKIGSRPTPLSETESSGNEDSQLDFTWHGCSVFIIIAKGRPPKKRSLFSGIVQISSPPNLGNLVLFFPDVKNSRYKRQIKVLMMAMMVK